MLACAEEKAVLAGLSLVHHRRGLLSGLNPAVPLVPCPLSKEFRSVADAYAKPVIEAAAHAPRLLFHEIAPHTAVRPSQHCGCEACQAAFVRAYRQDLPDAPIDKLGLATHRNVCSFVASTWWHAYERVVELRDAADGPRLSLPFDAASFVRDGRQDPFCDVETWSRAADVVEVAPERDLRLWRLSLSGHRALCAAREKDFGAVLDLAKGSPPPAEAAWTALANGAAHLRVAGNPRFLFWDRQEPIDIALGDTFRRIARIGSLLACAQRPRARLALLLPSTQIVDGDGGHILSAFELLYRGFGDVDILHQRLLDDHLGDYAALALLGSHVLPRRTVRALVRFVEDGGVLLAEAGQLLDETGAPVVWPDGFLGTAETQVFEHIACRRRAYGSGRTVCFTASVVAAFERALAEDDAVAVTLLGRSIADELAQRGIRPHALSSNTDVEVALLSCGGSQLLVAVNHSEKEQAAAIAVESDATVAFELFSGAEQDVKGRLRVSLPGRDGAAWLLAAERPFAVRVEALESSEGRASFRVNVLAGSGAPATGSWPLRVTVTDADGRERPELGGSLVALDGSLTVDWPLAANDPPGAWTVAACDAFTRRMSRATLHVPTTSQSPDGEAS
jgi:hypothetical protein